MTPEQFVKEYSHQRFDYTAQLIIDENVSELLDVAQEYLKVHEELRNALYAIGFETD